MSETGSSKNKKRRNKKSAKRPTNLCTLFDFFLRRRIIPPTPMGGHLDDEVDDLQHKLGNLRIVKNP